MKGAKRDGTNAHEGCLPLDSLTAGEHSSLEENCTLDFDGCPNHLPAWERPRAIIEQEGVYAEVSEIEVRDESTAKALAFPGSPTIRINGLDIDPALRGSVDAGFACRRYPGGLPSEAMIRAALREVGEQGK